RGPSMPPPPPAPGSRAPGGPPPPPPPPGYLLPEQPGGIRHACRGNKFDLETVSSPDTCSSPDSRHLPQAPQVESIYHQLSKFVG
ncbi:unnamed protein product, partial [Penicillium olsonii]